MTSLYLRTLLGPVLVWKQQNYLKSHAADREVFPVLLVLLPPWLSTKEKQAPKWVNEWVCRPRLNLSIYKIVFSLFPKSKCRIQIIKHIWTETCFLWKSVKSIPTSCRRENGVDTLKLNHDTLLKNFKKNTDRSQWGTPTLVVCCWSLVRDNPSAQHSGKSMKRTFLTLSDCWLGIQSNAGVPNLSLFMYFFSISTD